MTLMVWATADSGWSSFFMVELYLAVAPVAIVPQSLSYDLVTMNMFVDYLLHSDYHFDSHKMESYHDAPNPWIPAVIRIDHPAHHNDHCAEPDLVGCCADAGL